MDIRAPLGGGEEYGFPWAPLPPEGQQVPFLQTQSPENKPPSRAAWPAHDMLVASGGPGAIGWTWSLLGCCLPRGAEGMLCKRHLVVTVIEPEFLLVSTHKKKNSQENTTRNLPSSACVLCLTSGSDVFPPSRLPSDAVFLMAAALRHSCAHLPQAMACCSWMSLFGFSWKFLDTWACCILEGGWNGGTSALVAFLLGPQMLDATGNNHVGISSVIRNSKQIKEKGGKVWIEF